MKKILFAIAAVFAAATATAQQMPPVPKDPNVTIDKLDNGLTYYIRHNEEPKGQANFYIAQKVGSILEEEDQRGLAHFLEHMCFNGTQKFPGNGIIKYCEKIGVKFGADLNAYTSIDETVYNIDNVPVSTVPEAVDSCLWILHDWADGLLLSGEEIDKERGVIHEEWRTRSNATLRQYEKMLPVIYPGNRYGERMPIGLMSVVDNFPYQALRDYYEKWYRPDQQGIVVVGDIDVKAVEAKIREIFGTIATPVNPAERYYVQVEDNKEPIVSVTTDKEQTYSLTYIFRKHDKFPRDQKDNMGYLVYQYAISMADYMLNQRLEEITQKPNPPFVQANIGDEDFFIAGTKGAYCGIAVTGENDVLKGSTTVYREMLRAIRNGFTASEYERARAEFMNNLESEYNQREKRKSKGFCKEYVRHFIDNEPIPGIEQEFALAQQITPNIPVEVINRTLAGLLPEGNLVISCMLPEKEGVVYPTPDEIKAAFAAVEAETIAPYEDKVSNEPLISDLPKAGKVRKTGDSMFGYRHYTLSNGANVYLKSTDFNKDEIRMSISSYGGTAKYPDSELVTLKSIGELLTIGGVGKFNSTELTKVLAGKKVSVNPYISSDSEGMSGSTTPKDFETMLQLTYLYFTSPRMDSDAFESWKTRGKAALQNAEANPMSSFNDSLVLAVYKNGNRFNNIKSSQVDEVNYARAIEIARERFADASDFNFIFTGNIDEKTALPLFEKYIGALPSVKGAKETCPDIAAFNPGVILNQYDRGMEIPMVTSFFMHSGKSGYTLKDKIVFNIAKQTLSMILLEEIREKEGGTYGISANGHLVCLPEKRADIQIAYQTDPKRYKYLNARVRTIVTEFAVNGPSEENLDKAKKYLQKKYTEYQKENSYFAGAIEEYLESGVNVVNGYEDILNSITAEDVALYVRNITLQGNSKTVIMHGVEK